MARPNVCKAFWRSVENFQLSSRPCLDLALTCFFPHTAFVHFIKAHVAIGTWSDQSTTCVGHLHIWQVEMQCITLALDGIEWHEIIPAKRSTPNSKGPCTGKDEWLSYNKNFWWSYSCILTAGWLPHTVLLVTLFAYCMGDARPSKSLCSKVCRLGSHLCKSLRQLCKA